MLAHPKRRHLEPVVNCRTENQTIPILRFNKLRNHDQTSVWFGNKSLENPCHNFDKSVKQLGQILCKSQYWFVKHTLNEVSEWVSEWVTRQWSILGAIEILLFEYYFDTFDCLSREGGIANRQNFFHWSLIIINVICDIIFISYCKCFFRKYSFSYYVYNLHMPV